MKDNESNSDLSRLSWACRRGMLELDVLLGHFLKEAYPTLGLEDKKCFIELLSESDPDLFSWLMGKTSPIDPRLARMTEMIRQHAKTRI